MWIRLWWTVVGCFAAFLQIGTVRQLLLSTALLMIVVLIVISWLDQGNVMLAGMIIYLLQLTMQLTAVISQWRLGFPVASTTRHFLLWHSKKNIDYEFWMNGVVLESIESEKDLGVMISHDLKTSNQCVRAYANSNTILGMINHRLSISTLMLWLNYTSHWSVLTWNTVPLLGHPTM